MTEVQLRGRYRRRPTPASADSEPNGARFAALSRFLLDSGCDALRRDDRAAAHATREIVQRRAAASA